MITPYPSQAAKFTALAVNGVLSGMLWLYAWHQFKKGKALAPYIAGAFAGFGTYNFVVNLSAPVAKPNQVTGEYSPYLRLPQRVPTL